MSLAQKLEQAKPVYKPRFEQYVDSLPKEDRDALVAAAADPGWTTAALVRVLKGEGVTVSKETVSAWRRNVLAR